MSVLNHMFPNKCLLSFQGKVLYLFYQGYHVYELVIARSVLGSGTQQVRAHEVCGESRTLNLLILNFCNWTLVLERSNIFQKLSTFTYSIIPNSNVMCIHFLYS